MLKQYFLELYKLRSKKKLTDRDINIFLKNMELTIKSVQKIIEQKVNEYVEKESK